VEAGQAPSPDTVLNVSDGWRDKVIPEGNFASHQNPSDVRVLMSWIGSHIFISKNIVYTIGKRRSGKSQF
jgi:hypothetical protein